MASFWTSLKSWFGAKPAQSGLRVLRKGPAMRVIFFYPGEEGTYVDNAQVTLYENGIVHIGSKQEESTTDLKNCEILWRFEWDVEEREQKFRVLKLRPDVDSESELSPENLD